MKRAHYRWLKVALVLLLVQLLVACAGANSETSTSNSGLQNTTQVQTFTTKVQEGMQSLELDLSLNVNKGSMNFRLTDPNGQVKWKGQAKANKYKPRTKQFTEPMVGTWTLELDMKSASGGYNITWRKQY